jgi:hypothetical protein
LSGLAIPCATLAPTTTTTQAPKVEGIKQETTTPTAAPTTVLGEVLTKPAAPLPAPGADRPTWPSSVGWRWPLVQR